MPIMTTQKLIDAAPYRWKGAYYNPDDYTWRTTVSGDTEQVYEKLKQLQNPTEDDIATIIGNRSWTQLVCDHCKQYVEIVSQFHVANEYLFQVCQNCLEKATDEIQRRP